MPCSNPSLAFFPFDRKTGVRSRKIEFVRPVVGMSDDDLLAHCRYIWLEHCTKPLLIPCGKCLHCLMMRARDWSFRCQCELETMGSALFLTLTYNDKFLPKVDGIPSLQRRDLQLFMKSLRKTLHGRRISYFGCGEYGSHGCRPHYHLVVFGLTLDDLDIWSRSAKGSVLYRSPTVERLWQRGYSSIGACSSQSIDYVTRYSLKKCSQDFGTFPVRPFTACSRRPAIALEWFNLHKNGLVKFDSDGKVVDASVMFRGRPMPLPRYFLKRYGLSDDEVLLNGLEIYRDSYRVFEDVHDLCSFRLEDLDAVSVDRYRSRSADVDLLRLDIPSAPVSADNARYESRTQGGEAAAERGNPSRGGFEMPCKRLT